MTVWPQGVARVPKEEWSRRSIGTLALKYDTVEHHGWYRNLDRTTQQLCAHLRDGHLLMDYSGGTGILAERLLEACSDRRFGILIVDSSPKFLRLALQKLGDNERVAFRLIRYLKGEGRLQLVDEVLEKPLLQRGVDAVVSTNAVHLYYDLEQTLRSWARLLRAEGRAFVQSGNIRNPEALPEHWIIDETVESIHREARALVRREKRYAAYRGILASVDRMSAYDRLREKFFIPVRPLDHYLAVFERAGLRVTDVDYVPIEARVDEWYEFLSTYHEGVLGWVGGSERIEGEPPSDAAVKHRLELLQAAMARIFAGRPTFQAGWTYITAKRRGAGSRP